MFVDPLPADYEQAQLIPSGCKESSLGSQLFICCRGLLVDLIGIEPMTSSMPWKRAPSCATGPLGVNFSILADAGG
jgi:hypothetical protein